MQELSPSILVKSNQNKTVNDPHLNVLKRPRSPTEEIVSYKIQAHETILKREFHQRLGPGVVKAIWMIRDLEELINSNCSPDTHVSYI